MRFPLLRQSREALSFALQLPGMECGLAPGSRLTWDRRCA